MTSPTIIDTHDSTAPLWASNLRSSTAGTVFVCSPRQHEELRFLPASLGPATTQVVLLDPFPRGAQVSLCGATLDVAVPHAASEYPRATEIWHLKLGGPIPPMPTFSTLPMPITKSFVCALPDGFLILDLTSGTFERVTPTGGVTVVATLPDSVSVDELGRGWWQAQSDALGVVLSLGNCGFYVRYPVPGSPPGPAVFLGGFDLPTLTPRYLLGAFRDVGQLAIRRLERTLAAANVGGAGPDFNTWPLIWNSFGRDDQEISELAGTDAGAVFTVTTSARDETYSSTCQPGVPATPLSRALRSLAPFEGGADVIGDSASAPDAGLYRLSIGSTIMAKVADLGTSWATTIGLGLSHGRAVYTDNAGDRTPGYLRPIPHAAAPGNEVRVSADTGEGLITIGGPFVAYTSPQIGLDTPVNHGRPRQTMTQTTVAGTVDGLAVSGNRLLVTGETIWLIDLLTGDQTSVNGTYAALWGNHLVTLDGVTEELIWHDLSTGVQTVVRPGLPTTDGIDENTVSMAVWGSTLLFNYVSRTSGTVSGHYDARTGHLAALPPLLSGKGFHRLAYNDDLVLAYLHRPPAIQVYCLRIGMLGSAVLAYKGEGPLALDGAMAGWRPVDDWRAVVKDIRDADALPAYAPSAPRCICCSAGSVVQIGGPAWTLYAYTTREVEWTLRIVAVNGSSRRTLRGSSKFGEIVARWTGVSRSGRPLPAGLYRWALTGTARSDGSHLTDPTGEDNKAAAQGELTIRY